MEQPERPGAQEWVPARPSLMSIREALPDCRGCELYQDATQAVMGEGPTKASLVLLGEQPGIARTGRVTRSSDPPAGSWTTH
jgi:uracil-DNA glycosylase